MLPITEHRDLLSILLQSINKEDEYYILDAGSGMTSLSLIISLFPNSGIDAIVYPGDLRKINSIKENIKNERYKLIECDICKNETGNNYDIVVAHLLLGEVKNSAIDLKICLTRC